MRELLDHLHVLPQMHLDRSHREKPRIELSILLAGIAHNIVEIHARQPAVSFFDVNLKVLIADGAKDSAAVMEYRLASAIAFTKQEQRCLIDTIRDTFIRNFIKRPARQTQLPE